MKHLNWLINWQFEKKGYISWLDGESKVLRKLAFYAEQGSVTFRPFKKLWQTNQPTERPTYGQEGSKEGYTSHDMNMSCCAKFYTLVDCSKLPIDDRSAGSSDNKVGRF